MDASKLDATLNKIRKIGSIAAAVSVGVARIPFSARQSTRVKSRLQN